MEDADTSQSCSSERLNSHQTEPNTSSNTTTRNVNSDSDSTIAGTTNDVKTPNDISPTESNDKEATLQTQSNHVQTTKNNNSSTSESSSDADECTGHLGNSDAGVLNSESGDRINDVRSETLKDPRIEERSDGTEGEKLSHAPSGEEFDQTPEGGKETDSGPLKNDPQIKGCFNDLKDEKHMLKTPSEERLNVTPVGGKETDSGPLKNDPQIKECFNDLKDEKHMLKTPSEERMKGGKQTDSEPLKNDPQIKDLKDEKHMLKTPSEERLNVTLVGGKQTDSGPLKNDPQINDYFNDTKHENSLLKPSEERLNVTPSSSDETNSSCPLKNNPLTKDCFDDTKHEKPLHTRSNEDINVMPLSNEAQVHSTTTHDAPGTPASPPITRSSELEVGRIDFSSTPKENLMRMISDLLDECDWLKREKQRLEKDLACLEADNSALPYLAQIETLEKSLAQAQADSCSLEQRLQAAEQNYMTENVNIRTDLTTRLERVTRQYESANKDKESMVIKYATSEREVIIAKKQKEALEKKMRDLEKERESLVNKNKMLISERARICQTLDTKVQKNNWYQREVDRLKDEVSGRDIKIKWTQAKLKSEMEGFKDCQEKLDHALTKITKHEEELKAIKEQAESIVQAAKHDENSRANVLDLQLKEEKARLIMERQVNEDRGSAYSKVVTEMEELKRRHQELQEEAVSLRSRLASRETEEEEMEKLFTCLRAEVTTARQEASELTHQLSNSTHLQQQLTREKEHLERANEEVDRLQTTNNDLENEVLACRQKEAELLAFTQKLSDKNVQIQSQFSALQSKTQLTEIEHEELKEEVEDLKQQKAKLKGELAKETQKHNTELVSMTQQLTDKTEENKKLTVRTLDLENEVKVLNRKHNNAIKDMTREMQRLKRRMELLHDHNNSSGGSGGGGGGGGNMGVSDGVVGVGGGGGVSSGRSSQSVTPHDSLSQGSRASSNTSLNTLEYHNNDVCPQAEDHLPPLNDPLVTQQLLVDRIIKLQKSAAKRAEKMEFLEEHNNQLVGELKKKSRIIHHYIMKEEAGALVNSASDTSKVELMRYGGIMASVYGSAPRDDTMTLDLSLEINRKLQAVLEDTLLKNITLKDNLNTLGDEIAKITQQKQGGVIKK